MKIDRVDHFVLTVASVERSCEFYSTVLGMEIITFAEGRKALRFGRQKINLHQTGKEFEPKATVPTAGSGDFCLITASSMDQVVIDLKSHRVAIELGPVQRSGSTGAITSVYIRDPDGNLIELSSYS